jgi:hypothetical protein
MTKNARPLESVFPSNENGPSGEIETKSPAQAIPAKTVAAPVGTAEYIAEMTAELASMARGSRLDLLAYFLDMACLEARNSARNLTLGRE